MPARRSCHSDDQVEHRFFADVADLTDRERREVTRDVGLAKKVWGGQYVVIANEVGQVQRRPFWPLRPAGKPMPPPDAGSLDTTTVPSALLPPSVQDDRRDVSGGGGRRRYDRREAGRVGGHRQMSTSLRWRARHPPKDGPHDDTVDVTEQPRLPLFG